VNDARITLADVAAASGVAISTVSRALSNPGRVHDATRARIVHAADELGYVSGSGLRTRAVALVVPDITNPYFFGIIRGTQHALRTAGYSLLLIDTEESEEVEYETLHRLRHLYDGVVLAASRLTDRQLIDLARRVPVVAVNRQTTGVPTVFIDTPSGVTQALQHLKSLGHRRIAFAAGPEGSWSSERRWRALTEAAGDVEVLRVGPFIPTLEAGAAAAEATLALDVTACIVFNDQLAIGMLQRMRSRGIRVPEDFSLVGCDDSYGAEICEPQLTTITAPIEAASRTAVAMLLTAFDGSRYPEARQSAILPTHLTVRGSSGPAPKETR